MFWLAAGLAGGLVWLVTLLLAVVTEWWLCVGVLVSLALGGGVFGLWWFPPPPRGQVDWEGVSGYGLPEKLRWKEVRRLQIGYTAYRGAYWASWLRVEWAGGQVAWIDLAVWDSAARAKSFCSKVCPGVVVEEDHALLVPLPFRPRG
jgi:hypothetical protein